MSISTQLAIIGAGPGGYIAAFHAADLGLSVTLIDKNAQPGGICLYEGCIPSKALLHAAKVITDTKESAVCGIEFSSPKIDTEKLRAWKNTIVAKLTNGLAQLNKARKITYIQGTARFRDSTTLEIKKTDGTTEELLFEKAIIATGSRPITLSGLPVCDRVWDSSKALTIPHIPETLLVVGGRYIGLELATAYSGLGASVTVAEATAELLSGADRDLADVVLRRMKKNFSGILPETKVVSGKESPEGIEVTFENKNGEKSSKIFEAVLVAIGRIPNTENLGLENTRVQLTHIGFIEVNPQRRTDDKNIFAIGDVAGNPMLAHKASAEARVAAEIIAGQSVAFEPSCIPAVVFTDPELAWVGLTEAEAKDMSLDVRVFKFPWAASGRAMTMNRTDGITKIIADTKTGRILGVGIAGVNAGELIAEGTLAIEAGIKAEEMGLTIHTHPTLSETLMESAEGIFGNPSHIIRPKK
ncbi:MAG: dihydrolipoyl dehydrogenase [Candidatus Omnitrophica bacterium]|nr:dihydrolipoyl dehydrogenase [Candidatus Omnitrophota bacterium]